MASSVPSASSTRYPSSLRMRLAILRAIRLSSTTRMVVKESGNPESNGTRPPYGGVLTIHNLELGRLAGVMGLTLRGAPAVASAVG